MRSLKIFLIILLTMVGLVMLLGVAGPEHYRYERSIALSASPEVVYPYLSSLSAMDAWSPWNDLDPAMKKSYEGQDGAVGSIQRWEGNELVGKGEMRLDSLAPGHLVKLELKFFAPRTSRSDVLLELREDGTGSTVTWAMVGSNDFLRKVVGNFMDMDALIGADLERGLELLKELVEVEQLMQQKELAARTFGSYVVERTERSAAVFVGKRAKVKFKDLDSFIASSMTMVQDALVDTRTKVIGTASNVYFMWDERTSTTELLVGFPIDASDDLKLEGLDLFTVPEGMILQVEHGGDIARIEEAHEALEQAMKARDLKEVGQRIEEYAVGPGSESDTSKWVTRVSCMVR
ncbi:MAG: SRPBCC family protein [Flavobacteriales bacterium]|nr:SRPBCC family protein [Flavobacteriales bacterium]